MRLAERGHLRGMPPTECLERMASVSVGRLGVTIGALPAILPVNFALHDEDVIIRSVEGSKLDAATTGMVVAFEVDDFDPDGAWGWSVLVQGIAEEVTDPAELARVRAVHLDTWAYPGGEAYRYLRLGTELMSGRRFDRSEAFTH